MIRQEVLRAHFQPEWQKEKYRLVIEALVLIGILGSFFFPANHAQFVSELYKKSDVYE